MLTQTLDHMNQEWSSFAPLVYARHRNVCEASKTWSIFLGEPQFLINHWFQVPLILKTVLRIRSQPIRTPPGQQLKKHNSNAEKVRLNSQS
eukprot:CAMPEP_0175915932 /NCGR_PEP_ID=MMETSP0108-20121206/10573_1 /TAXON_ID=195067 ORGANISM="Goniomonas pacifica, Strain CCMP1869" /NCGR_SAMPLE_ID=MMETSP0108 /ASSEMBLY_ACC=CAM_ASM_000204 /LENGTH=90 /DNA_ID=CAMNT_0017238443 /DNA_START=808 /DNA_END=1076 /DNA_ORIENTATION=-